MPLHAAADRLEFAPPPPPGQWRAFALAVLAHLLLLLALTWGVNWKRDAEDLSVEAELWSALPREAAPKAVEAPPPPPAPPPAPAPAPQVAPPPPPVNRDADIALEREKKKQEAAKKAEEARELRDRQERERQKQADLKRAQEKKAADVRKAVEEKQAADKKLADKKADDRKKQDQAAKTRDLSNNKEEARKLELQRQENMKRIAGMAGASGGESAKGDALKSSGPSASYGGRIRAAVRPNIVFSDDVAGNPTAEVEVRASPDGTVVGTRLIKSSGVKAWDDAVLKAIDKTAVLPRDTDGRVPSTLIIAFRPKD